MHLNNIKIIIAIIILSLFLSAVLPIMADELQTRYTMVIYENPAMLKEFNKRLYLSRLNRILKKRKVETIEDEVKHKIDIIVEKVRAILDMYPANLRFRVVLYPDKTTITQSYRKLYNSKRTVVGFYDPNINTVYFSVKNAELKVTAHEFGHAVVANFFEVSPPVKIHELMAQFAEKHILD